MFLNLYNLLVLDHIAPGALFALIVAWYVASWSTRHFAFKEAHAHADSLQLAGEDRRNFLEWRIGELALQAQDKVGPTTGVLFAVLMLAAYHGHAATVQALVDRGADVDLGNARGQAPIAGALFKGEDDVVRVLRAAGADLDAGVPSARVTAEMFGRSHLLD